MEQAEDMGKNEPIFNIPSAIVGALGVLFAIHFARLLLPPDLDAEFLWAMAFVPARYAEGGQEIPGGSFASVTSFVSYMLVHGDGVHLAVNSIWMLAFGSAVAKRAGSMRFLLFSLACGIAGALVHLALYFGDLRPVVGASAAISGQMAAALRFILARRGHISYSSQSIAALPLATVGETMRNPRILAVVAIWTAVNLIFGLGFLSFDGSETGIAWEAHIGGFLLGLLGFGLFDRPQPPPFSAPTMH